MTIDYRITKYDPALRDAQDVFTGDDWTSCAQIGRAFGGVILTDERYRQTEALHVQTLSYLLSCEQRTTFRLLGLEYTPAASTRRGFGLDGDTDARLRKLEPMGLREGNTFDAGALSLVVPLILREVLWARISFMGGFFHFGHDYYVYARCTRDWLALGAAPSRRWHDALFIEPVTSPYIEQESP